jgi:hypothetical protein
MTNTSSQPVRIKCADCPIVLWLKAQPSGPVRCSSCTKDHAEGRPSTSAAQLEGALQGKVVFKHEQTLDRRAVGPVWVNGTKESQWVTRADARAKAKRLGLEFEES